MGFVPISAGFFNADAWYVGTVPFSSWECDRLVDVLGSAGPVINGVFEALGPRSKAFPEDNTFDRFSSGYRSGEYTLKDVRRKKKEGIEQYPYGKP